MSHGWNSTSASAGGGWGDSSNGAGTSWAPNPSSSRSGGDWDGGRSSNGYSRPDRGSYRSYDDNSRRDRKDFGHGSGGR
ncbi:hypothetical protein LPJ57_010520, partial [Coemansia sp. RSA 486]